MENVQAQTLAIRRGHSIKIAVSVVFVLVLIALLVFQKGISLREIADLIGRFGWTCAGLVFVCTSVQGVLNIIRIYNLFPRALRPGLGRVAYAIAVGQLANTFLPARAGDVLKALIFGRDPQQPDLSVMTGAGVIIADKVVDFTAFVTLILVSGAYHLPGVHLPIPHAAPGVGAALGGLAIVLVGAGFWVLRSRLRALARWVKDFRSGLGGLLRPLGVVTALATGLGVWVCEALALRILAHYQGFDLAFGQSVFVLCVLNLAIAVPVSVANVGMFEASIAFGLTTSGIPLPVAVAIAATHHLIQLVAVVVLAGATAAQQRWRRAAR
jgi:uncharacterized membrane protein YbhN (UPF0104 family)